MVCNYMRDDIKDIRIKRLKKNTFSPLIFRVLNIVLGIILPRVYLQYYGSSINGLINSITQFLNFISILELGMGAIVESALYKPLANKENDKISSIVVSAKKFYRSLAKILVIYVVLLIFIFPSVVNNKYDIFYTGFLIIAISIGLFANYYFGIVNTLLLNADQRGYVQYNIQIIMVVVNFIVSVFMISHGFDIQMVKLTTGFIYLMRPIYLYFYVRKNYLINWKIYYDVEPLEQKWNGIAQHVANLVLENTDIILLTFFSTLSTISVYSIYSMIVSSIERLFSALTNGVLALWGELWVKGEKALLIFQFKKLEWIVHNLVIFIYGCTGMLIVPFVKVYTHGINDVNYDVPIFAVVITSAYLARCIQRPYTTLCFAANKYSETQNCYLITAIINIIISVIAVNSYGLIGVAIGTFCAMTYQMIWMLIYSYKKLLQIPIKGCIKLFVEDIFIILVATMICLNIRMQSITYISWIILAIRVAFVWGCIILITNVVLYKKYIIWVINKILRKKNG